MNDTKLSCLVEGYEGTYFEIGQIWETRGGDKYEVINFNFGSDTYKVKTYKMGNPTFKNFYTQKGEDWEGEEAAEDLVKLIISNTLSEYLKENNAYESFIENCVEEFLQDMEYYKKYKMMNRNISLNTFTWENTKEGFSYWSYLLKNKPEKIIYDMNEIVFAEVEKSVYESEFITDEKFNKILEKTSKRYMIFVEGKDTHNEIYTGLEKAEIEAKRLAAVEVGLKVSIVKIVKEYKSKVDVYEV